TSITGPAAAVARAAQLVRAARRAGWRGAVADGVFEVVDVVLLGRRARATEAAEERQAISRTAAAFPTVEPHRDLRVVARGGPGIAANLPPAVVSIFRRNMAVPRGIQLIARIGVDRPLIKTHPMALPQGKRTAFRGSALRSDHEVRGIPWGVGEE